MRISGTFLGGRKGGKPGVNPAGNIVVSKARVAAGNPRLAAHCEDLNDS